MADLITSLPDEIICYILYFLPSQQVVATSVLSQRWNLLWRSVPSLDFDISTEEFWSLDGEKTSNTFYNAVASFLVRRGDQPLHIFRLRSYIFFNDSKLFNKWIKDAVSGSGRLQHLDLSLFPRIVVPSQVFSCKTLVVLKLDYIIVKNISFVDLPLLKVLHLNYIYSSVGIDLFLSGSPNLEVLEALNTGLLPKGKFNKCSKLVRANIDGDLVSLGIVNNVEFLFINEIRQKELFDDFPNLVELQLEDKSFRIKWVEVLLMLKHCSKLETLAIDLYKCSFDCPLENPKAVWPYPESVPTCISSQLKTCRFENFSFMSEIQFAKYILQNAKYLQTMKIKIDTYIEAGEKLNMIRDLSSCLKSSDTCTLSFE